MRRAARSLPSARNVLADGDNDFAVARAYYAMFYAATAALLSRGVSRTKHSAVITAFGEHFVKVGHVTLAQQTALQVAFRERNEGDYHGYFPPREDVESRLAEATEFVEAVGALLRSEGIDV
jgi:uncharacterized protein (UPF0332 family)